MTPMPFTCATEGDEEKGRCIRGQRSARRRAQPAPAAAAAAAAHQAKAARSSGGSTCTALTCVIADGQSVVAAQGRGCTAGGQGRGGAFMPGRLGSSRESGAGRAAAGGAARGERRRTGEGGLTGGAGHIHANVCDLHTLNFQVKDLLAPLRGRHERRREGRRQEGAAAPEGGALRVHTARRGRTAQYGTAWHSTAQRAQRSHQLHDELNGDDQDAQAEEHKGCGGWRGVQTRRELE